MLEQKGLGWLYPNDQEKFEEMWDRIHIKRDQTNCFVVVRNLSDEQLRAMHYRKSDGAIAYRGTLRTDRMKIQDTPRG